MATINLAPFMGGIVINQSAWRRIPEKYRADLQKITKQVEREIEASFSKLEEEAVHSMSQYGLVVNRLNPRQEEEWYKDAEKYTDELISVFNKDMYEKITAILRDYRRGR
jgi:TRAP-type C4-dicarboxylate transport system substrate-binding protein